VAGGGCVFTHTEKLVGKISSKGLLLILCICIGVELKTNRPTPPAANIFSDFAQILYGGVYENSPKIAAAYIMVRGKARTGAGTTTYMVCGKVPRMFWELSRLL